MNFNEETPAKMAIQLRKQYLKIWKGLSEDQRKKLLSQSIEDIVQLSPACYLDEPTKDQAVVRAKKKAPSQMESIELFFKLLLTINKMSFDNTQQARQELLRRLEAKIQGETTEKLIFNSVTCQLIDGFEIENFVLQFLSLRLKQLHFHKFVVEELAKDLAANELQDAKAIISKPTKKLTKAERQALKALKAKSQLADVQPTIPIMKNPDIKEVSSKDHPSNLIAEMAPRKKSSDSFTREEPEDIPNHPQQLVSDFEKIMHPEQQSIQQEALIIRLPFRDFNDPKCLQKESKKLSKKKIQQPPVSDQGQKPEIVVPQEPKEPEPEIEEKLNDPSFFDDLNITVRRTDDPIAKEKADVDVRAQLASLRLDNFSHIFNGFQRSSSKDVKIQEPDLENTEEPFEGRYKSMSDPVAFTSIFNKTQVNQILNGEDFRINPMANFRKEATIYPQEGESIQNDKIPFPQFESNLRTRMLNSGPLCDNSNTPTKTVRVLPKTMLTKSNSKYSGYSSHLKPGSNSKAPVVMPKLSLTIGTPKKPSITFGKSSSIMEGEKQELTPNPQSDHKISIASEQDAGSLRKTSIASAFQVSEPRKFYNSNLNKQATPLSKISEKPNEVTIEVKPTAEKPEINTFNLQASPKKLSISSPQKKSTSTENVSELLLRSPCPIKSNLPFKLVDEFLANKFIGRIIEAGVKGIVSDLAVMANVQENLRKSIKEELTQIVASLFPDQKVSLAEYGSSSTKLLTPFSDMDLAVTGCRHVGRVKAQEMLKTISEHLSSMNNIKSLKPILTASIPVLKLKVEGSPESQMPEINVDIVIDLQEEYDPIPTSFRTTEFICRCIEYYPSFFENVLFLKYALNYNSLSSTYKGSLIRRTQCLRSQLNVYSVH